jgi:hypothetical protein
VVERELVIITITLKTTKPVTAITTRTHLIAIERTLVTCPTRKIMFTHHRVWEIIRIIIDHHRCIITHPK